MSQEPTLEQHLEHLDSSIKHSQREVELATALARLRNNRDWKKLIDGHYMLTHVADLVKGSAAPSAQREDVRKDIERDIAGVGSFHQFLVTTEMGGQHALQAIDECNEMREELLAAGE